MSIIEFNKILIKIQLFITIELKRYHVDPKRDSTIMVEYRVTK